VRLIDGATEAQLWSETYDRKLQDVFAIQSEIAQEVAKELNAKLSPEEKSKLLRTDTESSEAYDLYLKGIYEYRTYTNLSIPLNLSRKPSPWIQIMREHMLRSPTVISDWTRSSPPR